MMLVAFVVRAIGHRRIDIAVIILHATVVESTRVSIRYTGKLGADTFL